MTPDPEGFSIAVMTADDVRTAIDWAAREGWNPGLTDAECFRVADPEGFLIGRLDGEAVSVISAVRNAGGFAFIGLYIVAPRWRGLGLGWRTWQAAMDRLGIDVVGLDGVVEQQANYALSGFALAHRNIRYSGIPHGGPHEGVEDLSAADLTQVAEYDAPCFGAARPDFLRRWLEIPGGRTAGVRDGDRLVGYGVVRPCRDGAKVGPLFADDPEIARAIVGRLVAHAGAGATVVLDVPEPNAAALALAREQGLEPVFETARMYRGGDPALPLERVFGITSFELG
jgi:ribosomal protein S18 acetylase RimI-like enzyme